jgi:hypothetical protein
VDSDSSGYDRLVGYRVNNNEIACFIKGEEFIDHMKNCRIIKDSYMKDLGRL